MTDTTSAAPSEREKDAAYQIHHATCPTCRAAGAAPGSVQRCQEGAQLWATYNQAGLPPHFTWLHQGWRKS